VQCGGELVGEVVVGGNHVIEIEFAGQVDDRLAGNEIGRSHPHRRRLLICPQTQLRQGGRCDPKAELHVTVRVGGCDQVVVFTGLYRAPASCSTQLHL
jgi:hypothetical protein